MQLLMRAGAWVAIGGVVAIAGWGLGEYEARAAARAKGAAPALVAEARPKAPAIAVLPAPADVKAPSAARSGTADVAKAP